VAGRQHRVRSGSALVFGASRGAPALKAALLGVAADVLFALIAVLTEPVDNQFENDVLSIFTPKAMYTR
jgi:hypothetical protein